MLGDMVASRDKAGMHAASMILWLVAYAIGLNSYNFCMTNKNSSELIGCPPISWATCGWQSPQSKHKKMCTNRTSHSMHGVASNVSRVKI